MVLSATDVSPSCTGKKIKHIYATQVPCESPANQTIKVGEIGSEHRKVTRHLQGRAAANKLPTLYSKIPKEGGPLSIAANVEKICICTMV